MADLADICESLLQINMDNDDAPEVVDKFVRKYLDDNTSAMLLEIECIRYSKFDSVNPMPFLYALGLVAWQRGRLMPQTCGHLIAVAGNVEFDSRVRNVAMWSVSYPGESYSSNEFQALSSEVERLFNGDMTVWDDCTIAQLARLFDERTRRDGVR